MVGCVTGSSPLSSQYYSEQVEMGTKWDIHVVCYDITVSGELGGCREAAFVMESKEEMGTAGVRRRAEVTVRE